MWHYNVRRDNARAAEYVAKAYNLKHGPEIAFETLGKVQTAALREIARSVRLDLERPDSLGAQYKRDIALQAIDKNQMDTNRWFKLNGLLMVTAANVLRSVFQERWRTVSGLAWDPSSRAHHLLMTQYFLNVPMSHGFLNQMCSREVDEWDLTLLCAAVLNSTLFEKAAGFRRGQPQHDAVMRIKKLRDFVVHSGAPSLSEERFVACFNETVVVLRTLGADIDLDADRDIAVVSHIKTDACFVFFVMYRRR